VGAEDVIESPGLPEASGAAFGNDKGPGARLSPAQPTTRKLQPHRVEFYQVL